MEQKVIRFTGIGTEPRIALPANYEGFTWKAYTDGGVFDGVVYVSTKENIPYSIYGVGFEMTLVDSNSEFDLNSILVEAANASEEEPVDVAVVGYRGELEVYREVIFPERTPARIELSFESVDRVQFISQMLSAFRVFEIDIAVNPV